MIEKIQFITQGNDGVKIIDSIKEVCEGGGKWIQLRIKDLPYSDIEEIARMAQIICKRYKVTFIVNDHVELAKKLKTDGVHLGKEDMPVSEARKILGSDCIIGGTANTFEDIQLLSKQGADYIGLGPFKFTETKKNLSPILGIEGYKSLMNQCVQQNIATPIVAVGGILIEDIKSIIDTGIYGIAVSGLIAKQKDKKGIIENIQQQF